MTEKPAKNDQGQYYSGIQWVVTDRGVNTINDEYFIEAERLNEGLCMDGHSWPQQLAAKVEWVDIEDFIKAYRVACIIFEIKTDWIETEIAAARVMYQWAKKN